MGMILEQSRRMSLTMGARQVRLDKSENGLRVTKRPEVFVQMEHEFTSLPHLLERRRVAREGPWSAAIERAAGPPT